MSTKNQITLLRTLPVDTATKTEMKQIVGRIAMLVKEKHT